MDDPLAMGPVQGIGHLDGTAQQVGGGKRAALDPIRERFAFEVLHHQVVNPILISDVVQCADVRMTQTRDGARLTLEPLAKLGTGGEMGGEHLDGDLAVQARVAGAVNLTHAAGTERGDYLVRAEPTSGCQGHSGAG